MEAEDCLVFWLCSRVLCIPISNVKKINLKHKHIIGIKKVIMIYTNALIRPNQYSTLDLIWTG